MKYLSRKWQKRIEKRKKVEKKSFFVYADEKILRVQQGAFAFVSSKPRPLDEQVRTVSIFFQEKTGKWKKVKEMEVINWTI